MAKELDNPFYHNYIFSEKDLDRAAFSYWRYPILLFLPTYVQINEGYVWFYKIWQGRYFFTKCEVLHSHTVTNS